MSASRVISILFVPAVAGCGPHAVSLGGGSSTTSAELDASSTMDAESDGPPSTFLPEHDAGGTFECSTHAQDCPAGHKCTPWASMGGGVDATRCVPIVPDPDQPGEACTVLRGSTDGEDTCDLGSWCMRVDPVTSIGTCFEFCVGDWGSEACPDPGTYCGGGYRDFPVCTESCCPAEQTCPEGEACYPVAHDFTCGAVWEPAGYAEDCEYVNACERGLYCANPDDSSDCSDAVAGCCLPFCRVGSNDCLAFSFALTCVPWFDGSAQSPGQDAIGRCVETQG